MGSSCTTSFMGFIRRRCSQVSTFFPTGTRRAIIGARDFLSNALAVFHNVPFRLLRFAHFFGAHRYSAVGSIILLKSSRPIATRFLAGSGTSINRGRPFSVELWDGKEYLITISANQFRQDLADAGYGNGRHAFRFATPPQLKDGHSHLIRLRVADRANRFAILEAILCR